MLEHSYWHPVNEDALAPVFSLNLLVFVFNQHHNLIHTGELTIYK